MKAHLMFRDRDVDLDRERPWNGDDLVRDLELSTLVRAMGGGDEYVAGVAEHALLSGMHDPQDIAYRQQVVGDCLDHPDEVRAIYDLALEAMRREKREYFSIFRDSPDTITRRSVRVLEMFTDVLRRLRSLADTDTERFRSEGFRRLFAMLSTELGDDYLREVRDHLKNVEKHGVAMSARLGTGIKGTDYVLRTRQERSWTEWMPFTANANLSFVLAERDEAGFRALRRLKDRGLNLTGNALAQATEHILNFFRMLATELAFAIGCLNLHERLTAIGAEACFPEPVTSAGPVLAAEGLYEPCLTLNTGAPAVGNDLDASGMSLVMVTGANQGGKSTFLRALGVAQLMMQCGMFVAARRFTADVRGTVTTHFKREEDAGMEHGKLDEELSRMSEIADHIGSGDLLLCNESFAATNEREGSEIARQVVRATTREGVKVAFVTHLFDLAHGHYAENSPDALFLRAEREPDGNRTFRIVPGEPLPTSFGADSYRKIFGHTTEPAQS